jgi:hypothetical protein
VDGLGEQVLPGACFSDEQDADIGIEGACENVELITHLG